jgi:hypothetical protein
VEENKLFYGGGMYSLFGFNQNVKETYANLKLPNSKINFNINEDNIKLLLNVINERQNTSFSINIKYFNLLKNIQKFLQNFTNDISLIEFFSKVSRFLNLPSLLTFITEIQKKIMLINR